MQQSIQRRERALLETKSKVTHPAYSLYFPEEKQEWWWLYIADRKDQTLVSMPYHVCTLKDTEEVSGFNIYTFNVSKVSNGLLVVKMLISRCQI